MENMSLTKVTATAVMVMTTRLGLDTAFVGAVKASVRPTRAVD